MRFLHGMKASRSLYGRQLGLCFLLVSLIVFLQAGVLRANEGGAPFAPKATADSSPYKYTVTERHVYRLSFKNSSASDFSILFQDMNARSAGKIAAPPVISFSFKTSVKGDLTKTVLDRKEGSTLISYNIRNARVTFFSRGVKDADQEENIRTDLEKPFYVLVGADGKIMSTWSDASVTTLSQTYMKGLLALTQVTFPSGPSQYEGWDADEEDPAGRYNARYKAMKSKGKAVGDQSLKTFLKRKINYLDPEKGLQTSHSVEIPTIIVPRGEFRVSFDFSRGMIKSLNGSESQDILINRKKVGRTFSRINMKYEGTETIEPAALSSIKEDFAAIERTIEATPLYSKPSKEESDTAIQTQQLGEATRESLLAEMKKAEAVADPKFNSMSLYLKFKALIYLQPESCASIGEVLKDAKADSLAMKILPTALNAIGHPQAQAALITAVKGHLQDKRALIPLLSSLATLEDPTEEAEDALREIALTSTDRDVASTAQLSLGAQARRLANSSPERADKIVGMFLEEIRKTKSTETTRLMLLALGNTGSPRALPEISRFTADPSADLRAPAVMALRFIDTPEAEAILTKVLLSDEDRGVRKAAASAFGYREMTKASFEAQKEALLTDKDEGVRLAILGNLWKAEESFPEVRKLVRRAATKDPSKEVRKAAKDIMVQHKEYFK